MMIVEGLHDDQPDTDIAIEADGTVFVRGDVISEDTFQSAVEAYSKVTDAPAAHRAKEALQSVASEMAYDDDVSIMRQYDVPLVLVDLEAEYESPRYVRDYDMDGLVLRHVATHHDGGINVEPPFLTFEIDTDEWGGDS